MRVLNAGEAGGESAEEPHGSSRWLGRAALQVQHELAMQQCCSCVAISSRFMRDWESGVWGEILNLHLKTVVVYSNVFKNTL